MKEPLIVEGCLSNAEIMKTSASPPIPTVDSAYASSEDGTESLPSPVVQKREKRLGSSGLTSSSSHQSLTEIIDNDVFSQTISKVDETTKLVASQTADHEPGNGGKREEDSLGILHDGGLHVVLTVQNSITEPDVLSCSEEDNIKPVDETQDKLFQTVALPMLWNLVPDASLASEALLSADVEAPVASPAYHKVSTASSSSSSTNLNAEVYTREPKTTLLDEGRKPSLIVPHFEEPPHSNSCLDNSKESLMHALGCCKRILHL